MPAADELLALNRRLLDAIAVGDWKTYEELCDPALSCFEPEARGHLVQGMEFHRFYFDLGGFSGPRNTTIVSPVVKFCGEDVAVVAYVRLTQKVDSEGRAATSAIEETRIWRREGNRWRHIHFHRSPPG
jgi:calcium/calmodulin-dependent protein kinase (CaM kinase) II